MTTCSEDGCEKKVVALGLCGMHRKRLKRHGHTKQTRPADWGKRENHPLYQTWLGMRRRCSDEKYRDFLNYGARGITVCDKWQNDFWAFVSDMGPKPSKRHSVERMDNNGNYTPDNCKWATYEEQARNRRSAVITEDLAIEIKRRMKFGDNLGDIARAMKLSYGQVRNVAVGQSWAD